jgi:cobalt/nickel transport system permease protein
MGVMGAFIFAAQMINFTIPGTGSSGHLGGGMLLAILLGPTAALVTIASVLFVQALFFADGGLLALGCNIFNLGVLPAFFVYPLLARPLARSLPGTRRFALLAMLGALLSLQLGSLGVVLETTLSGLANIPFKTFLTVMQPIHLAIGVIEGLVTAAVLTFVYQARPDIWNSALSKAPRTEATNRLSFRRLLAMIMVSALVVGGFLSWTASENPDGLEWSLQKVTGQDSLATPASSWHQRFAALQKKISFLPDYNFKEADSTTSAPALAPELLTPSSQSLGTSLSGVIGGILTLGLIVAFTTLLQRFLRRHGHHQNSARSGK